MEENGNRTEANRLLGIAEKLLQNRDFNGSRDFAILAQETEPLLDGSDQILAIVDVILSAEKKVNNHSDWYSILQIDGRSDDNDLIKKQYRRLALLLHPDKNKFPFSDHAFKHVADAWAVLSNGSKKSAYDKELNLFTKIDLTGGGSNQAGKLPVTRKGQTRTPKSAKTRNENPRSKSASFWTACPYCYRLFEFPRAYEDCCLKCHNCVKSFHAVEIPTLPPLVPGKDAYYCCWAFFPLGFVTGNPDSEVKSPPGFPNWMHSTAHEAPPQSSERTPVAAPPLTTVTPPLTTPRTNPVGGYGGSVMNSGPRKRGRPRKFPL